LYEHVSYRCVVVTQSVHESTIHVNVVSAPLRLVKRDLKAASRTTCMEAPWEKSQNKPQRRPPAAQRRWPRRGCARMPVGTPSSPCGGRWKPRSRARLGTVGLRGPTVRSARFAAVGKALHGGLLKIIIFCTLLAPRSPARAVRYAFSRPDTTKIPSHLGGWGLYLKECVMARSVRTYQRWDAGVGACGGKPGSNASV
jgi:hypothetical protein